MTTQTTPVSIETLAQRLNGNLWTKGEIRRIYLDRGYNTKKMSTKTYVYQKEDGTFGVSCKIECPSQAYQWIESQENEVIESVTKEIEKIIELSSLTLVKSKVLTEGTSELMVYVKRNDEEPVWYTEDAFYNAFEVYPDSVFEGLPEIKYEPVSVAPESVEPKQATINPITTNTNTPQYGVNTKVKHSKFGLGIVTAESDNLIDVTFETVGAKQLVKKFVVLEIVE